MTIYWRSAGARQVGARVLVGDAAGGFHEVSNKPFDRNKELSKNTCLGIHYSGLGVTAVLVVRQKGRLSAQQAYRHDADCHNSTMGQLDDESAPAAIDGLAADVGRDHVRKPPVALAVGGRLYQSELHHSEFKEDKQLAQTLQFDIEEGFMEDSETMVLSYQRRPSEESGSDLIVHVARRDEVEPLFSCLERHGLDALTAEPDLAAWLHYLRKDDALQVGEINVVVAWADGELYTLILNAACEPILARSLVCPEATQAGAAIARELPRTLALLGSEQQPQRILYHADGIDPAGIESLARRLQCATGQLSEPDARKAFAAGAAMGWLEGQSVTDFRADGLEPRTLVHARSKAMYGLSGAAAGLLLVLIVILHAHAARYAGVYKGADENMMTAWKMTHPGQPPIARRSQIKVSMAALKQQVLNSNQGQSASLLPDSAGSTLMLLLQTLDKLPTEFDLQIKSITAGADYIRLAGSVPDLRDRAEIDAVIADTPELAVTNSDFTQITTGSRSNGDKRRTFNMSLRVVKAAGLQDEQRRPNK